MKKKWVWITAIILLFTFPITACSSKTNTLSTEENQITSNMEIIETEEIPKAEAIVETNNEIVKGKIDNLTDYTDAWTELYASHEAAINAYTGMPIMSLVIVGLPLANAIFYSLLDLENKDGNFSGPVGFGGTEGYYNKSGNIAKFGQDWIRDIDGSMTNEKAGDRVVSEGIFDSSKGYFKLDDSIERDGKIITRTYTEFIRLNDGSFLCLYQDSSDFDYSGNENKFNELTFIIMGQNVYEFVKAKGDLGISGELCTLTEGMTIKDMTAQFQKLGYTVSESGGIQDGVFVVN